jgi:hypothetical protein
MLNLLNDLYSSDTVLNDEWGLIVSIIKLDFNTTKEIFIIQ